jgi:galactokinase
MSAAQAAAIFREAFGHEPTVVASAPGRVNLIGEHTDYNGGQVLPIAIGRRTWVAMARAPERESTAVSQGQPKGSFSVAAERPAGAWWDYVHGTLRELRALGIPIQDVRVAVVSDVPIGAGLSSSAALEVASALAAIVTARDRVLDRWEDLAMAAHRAESEFVGVACGMMDQTVSAYAAAKHALHIWCDSGRREHVRFDRAVLVFDTATPRNLRSSRFNDRRAECTVAFEAMRRLDPALSVLADATLDMLAEVTLPDEITRRARHVITETRRVADFVQALDGGGSLGTILLASHESLRTDYDCSTPELDWVVEEAMRAPGIEGARLTGAGWGGCAIIIGDEDDLRALVEPLVDRFAARWRRSPRAWLTTAEDGADIDYAEQRRSTASIGL